MSNLLVQNIKHTNNTTAATVDSSGGVAVAGTLAVTGVHTVGNNAIYTSDSGAVTQNLVQGLCKAWVSFDGTGTIATRDTFNVSSLNDDGTGKYDFVYTSNMASQNYAPAICGAFDDNDGNGSIHVDVRRQAPSTNQYGIRGLSFGSDASGAFNDVQFCYAQIAGDLA